VARVGVVTGSEDADEEFHRGHRTGGGIDDPRLLPGVIDEDLLPGPMVLTHGEAVAGQPAAVEIAEPRVAVAGGMLLEVLEMEEF
jgi:hypothetical protein